MECGTWHSNAGEIHRRVIPLRDGAPQDHEDLLESATREAHHQYTLGLASHGHGGSRSNYR